jgi:hypothetical protein
MTITALAATDQDKLPKNQVAQRPSTLCALLILDAFALGGLVAVELVRQLLISIMNRLISAAAQAEILNVLDHLFPYQVGYLGATFLISLITISAYLWLRTRSWIITSLAFFIPLALPGFFWASRVLGI